MIPVTREMPKLISWNTYREREKKKPYVRVHNEMTRDGFHLYVDVLDLHFTVCGGETSITVAKELFSLLKNEKPLQRDSDVVWTRMGQYVALYYKTSLPTKTA